MYHGDLLAFCDELRAKGMTFPVELKEGVSGKLLCYVSAPDGFSIELMQASSVAVVKSMLQPKETDDGPQHPLGRHLNHCPSAKCNRRGV